MSTTDHRAAGVTTRDAWIVHPQGRMLTRTWLPAEESSAGKPASPIVLFHDSLGSVELWRDFPAELSMTTRRQVIAYDRLGCGRSDPRVTLPSLDFIAEEASIYFPAMREQLGVQRFVAVGHSVGGGMAIHCAARYGIDCEAVVTIAAQVFAEDRTLQGIREAREQFKDASQMLRVTKYHGEKARWVLDAWIERWLDPDFASWTLANVLPRVACPLLAIHGAVDEYGSTRHAELIGSLSGGASRVEILADTGHLPHRERPQAVLELIADFLGA
jgi:pimeloyl-ACP methyl ester carboxylesterase